MSTVRDLVFHALTSDTELTALGIDTNHAWASGSVEGPQPAPFIVIKWGNTSKGIGPINTAPVQIFVHDDIGDYGVINSILLRVRAVMTGLAAHGYAANWIIEVDWLGDSGDLADDTYKTLMRNAEFNVVANTL